MALVFTEGNQLLLFWVLAIYMVILVFIIGLTEKKARRMREKEEQERKRRKTRTRALIRNRRERSN